MTGRPLALGLAFIVLSHFNVPSLLARRQASYRAAPNQSAAALMSNLDAWNTNICGLSRTNGIPELKFTPRPEIEGPRYVQDGSEFPWFVWMEITFRKGTKKCAGTLINSDLVVTAASCFKNQQLGLAISASVKASSVFKTRPDSLRQIRNMHNVCFAKEFDPNRRRKRDELGHNLALEKKFESRDCQLVGFEIDDENDSRSDSDQLVVAPMRGCSSSGHLDEECYEAAADDNRKRPCPGSPGNGLYCRHELSNYQVLVGVLTSDKVICRSGSLQPTLFTSLHKLREPLNEIFTDCLDLVDDLDF